MVFVLLPGRKQQALYIILVFRVLLTAFHYIIYCKTKINSSLFVLLQSVYTLKPISSAGDGAVELQPTYSPSPCLWVSFCWQHIGEHLPSCGSLIIFSSWTADMDLVQLKTVTEWLLHTISCECRQKMYLVHVPTMCILQPYTSIFNQMNQPQECIMNIVKSVQADKTSIHKLNILRETSEQQIYELKQLIIYIIRLIILTHHCLSSIVLL